MGFCLVIHFDSVTLYDCHVFSSIHWFYIIQFYKNFEMQLQKKNIMFIKKKTV